MDNQEIKRFIRKVLLISIPFWIITAIYIALDPFKVIWHYDQYFSNNETHVALNIDYVSTENFMQLNAQQQYNAFIFGNSRSQYWKIADWRQHINSEARCYHYYGNGESLDRLYHNIRFIHQQGNDIDYAILVVDAELLSQTESIPGHLFCTPPRVKGYQNLIKFHAANFVAFLNPTFIIANVDYRLNHQLRNYMMEKFLFEQPIVYDALSNEITDKIYDEAIENGTYYTAERMKRFQDRQFPDSVSPAVLKAENVRMLREIAGIFQEHHTAFKIVISPLYDQIHLNSQDLHQLQTIFGIDNISDSSGKNEITSDYRHYYEESHYLPKIARKLMEEIYQIKN